MLQLKHIGGADVEKGTYWNFTTGERISIEGKGILPGGSATTYYRVNPLAILVAGPVMGLVYAVFLPFIGIAMLARMIVQKAFGGAFESVAKGASFGWRPVEAYLAGKKDSKSGKESNKTS